MNEIDDVIKNVIHIDKSACEQRRKVKDQLRQREEEVNNQIDNLKKTIIDDKRKQLKEIEEKEIKKAEEEESNITKEANTMCSEMEAVFQKNKKSFTEEMFNKIFLDKNTVYNPNKDR